MISTPFSIAVALISGSMGQMAVESPVSEPMRTLFSIFIFPKSIMKTLKFMKELSPIKIVSPYSHLKGEGTVDLPKDPKRSLQISFLFSLSISLFNFQIDSSSIIYSKNLIIETIILALALKTMIIYISQYKILKVNSINMYTVKDKMLLIIKVSI